MFTVYSKDTYTDHRSANSMHIHTAHCSISGILRTYVHILYQYRPQQLENISITDISKNSNIVHPYYIPTRYYNGMDGSKCGASCRNNLISQMKYVDQESQATIVCLPFHSVLKINSKRQNENVKMKNPVRLHLITSLPAQIISSFQWV